MSIRPINKNKVGVNGKEKEKDKPSLQVDLMNVSDRLMEEYLDRYEGVKLEILNMTRFDEIKYD